MLFIFAETIPVYNKKNRIDLLDGLRGSAMIYVVLYHLLYDLIFFMNMDIPFFFSQTNQIIHVGFLIILFCVSGICTAFSSNSLKRGVMLMLIGEIITIGFSLFAPRDIIVFGVLSYFGVSMILYEFIKPIFKKIPWQTAFFSCIFLYILLYNFGNGEINLIFTQIHINLPKNADYLYPIGITSEHFISSDYFPLIPNLFIFLAGTALSAPIKENKFPLWFYKVKIPIIRFIGKHSLIIYLVHQPIFMILIYIYTVLRS